MYAIMRVEKRKRSAVYGLQIEANRTKKDHEAGRDFASSDIDWERTKNNLYFKGYKCENWNAAISERVKAAGAKERADSVVLIDALYTASPAYFEGKSDKEVIDYFKDCLRFHMEHYGQLLNAVIHRDESGAIHMHACSVPLIQDEKGARLSAKELLGDRSAYRERQTAFYERVGKPRGLERGNTSPADKKRHLSVQDYKKQQNATKLAEQSEQLERGAARLRKLDEAVKRAEELAADKVQTLADVEEVQLMQDFIRVGVAHGADGSKKPISLGWQEYLKAHGQERTSCEIAAELEEQSIDLEDYGFSLG